MASRRRQPHDTRGEVARFRCEAGSLTPMVQTISADWVSAWASVAAAVFAGLLLLVAVLAYVAASRTLTATRAASEAARLSAESARRANEQAERDSRDRTRPYVHAQVVPSISGLGCADLVIANSGQSAARDLHLSFDGWPDHEDELVSSLREMFDTPRTLPPGRSLRVAWVWRAVGELAKFNDGKRLVGMSEDGTITVKYGSDDPSAATYVDSFDARVQRSGLWPAGEEGLEPPTSMKGHELAFYRLGQRLVRRLSELTR